MRSVRHRRIRLSPILITPLIGVILTSLFSISDLATGLFIAISLILGLLALTDTVDKRIAANVEKAGEAGKLGKRKLRTLNWPKISLRQGVRSFGLSALLFFIQIAVDHLPEYIPLLNSYSIFAFGAVVLGLIGAFYAGLIAEFILNPNFRPPINLTGVLLFLVIGVLDGMTIYLFIPLYPVFETVTLVIKIFTILLIPSFVSSFLFLWAWWKEKSKLLVNATYYLALSPYIFIIAVYFFFVFYVLIGSFRLSICVGYFCGLRSV